MSGDEDNVTPLRGEQPGQAAVEAGKVLGWVTVAVVSIVVISLGIWAVVGIWRHIL